MSSQRGVVLVAGQVAVLAIDNTMVYVEQVTPTFAAVVALPEQPATRTDDRVFTPGKVGAKKISPYSLPDENFPDSADGIVPVTQLSQRNRDFIGTYEKLREVNGPNFVDQTEEEKAVTVKKVKPPKVDREARKAERVAARDAKKAERAAARAPVVCQGCEAQYFRTDTGIHFAGADETSPMWGICATLLARVAPRLKQPRVKDPKVARAPKASGNKTALRFKLVNDNLAAASAAKDKFKANNRGHRVYQAFKVALGEYGDVVTVAQVIAAATKLHGADWSNDPEGVCYNALNDLSKDTLGNVTELVK